MHTPPTAKTNDDIELIVFLAGPAEYCIDVQNVREIRGWSPATPLPHAPDHVMGIINLRGLVLPVIDLKSLLGLGKTDPSGRHVMIVVHDDIASAAVLVDSVHETIKTPRDQLQPAPVVGIASGNQLVSAILPYGGRMLSQLIVQRLLPQVDLAAA